MHESGIFGFLTLLLSKSPFLLRIFSFLILKPDSVSPKVIILLNTERSTNKITQSFCLTVTSTEVVYQRADQGKPFTPFLKSIIVVLLFNIFFFNITWVISLNPINWVCFMCIFIHILASVKLQWYNHKV